MKASLDWIREFTDIPMSAKEYQERMIMSGNGIEGLIDPGMGTKNVVVGRVTSCIPHPDSDHLHLCRVDTGDRTLQIVCGAPNVKEGQLVPVALVGAALPGGMTIRKGKIRGVESEGMICSASELGIPQDLYPSVGEAGILVFQEDYAPGTDVLSVFHLDDTVADFEILANRPDCLSIWGLAHETAAVMDTPFKAPFIRVLEAGGDIGDCAKVTVLDQNSCPRYMARVIKNIRVAQSPLWLRARLHKAGIRSINNIVDITNYVMLETGHPMHAFDLHQVRGRHIIVRQASSGENLTTLDGKVHELLGGELLICDEQGPTGLAGIMGGLESEITENTGEILFECAAFDSTLTRLVSRRLGIRTESGARFERGVNPATCEQAINRACQLVNELSCGEVVSGSIDVYPHPVKPVTLNASVERIARRAGTVISGEEMRDILTRLAFDISLNGDRLTATAPDFRQDIAQEADLCEEVLRLAGYDRIPETLLRGEVKPGGDSASRRFERGLLRVLNGIGYDEIVNISFTGMKQLELLGLQGDDSRLAPLHIRNPLGEDTAVMRTTLAPDMFRVLGYNMSQRNREALLCEFGTLYDPGTKTDEGLITETRALCLGAYGEELDFYAVRDAVVLLLEQSGIQWDIVSGGEPYLHPGRSARILVKGRPIAVVGEIHPDAAGRFDLTGRAFLAEIDLAWLYACAKPFDAVTALLRTPAVTRDIALVVDEKQPLLPLQREIMRAAGKLLESIELFDVFRGKQLPEGKKSAAFSLTLRGADKTLEESEIADIMARVTKTLKEQFKAEIRS